MTKTNELLDPKNDYVFFRIFSEEPELLIDLINAVRADQPPITEITLLDARLTPERIQGKRLVLDLRGIDEQGRRYNIEIQVRRLHRPQRNRGARTRRWSREALISP